MPSKLCHLLLTVILLIGCSAEHSTDTNSDLKISVPNFFIQPQFSNRLKAKLLSSGETVSCSIVFDGLGIPKNNKKHDPHRPIFLGEHTIALSITGNVQVSNAYISKEQYDRLSDKNYYVEINTFSSRKVFENNIVDHGFSTFNINDLRKNNVISVKCDLL